MEVGRRLLTVPEVGEGEDGLTEAPESVTKIEILPANVSQEECVEPAVKQFPSPILGRTARRQGGVVLHILIACYMFIGLAIVCDEYFVPALERMSDVLGLSPDVAGNLSIDLSSNQQVVLHLHFALTSERE